MKDPRSINALDVAERFANGDATKRRMEAALPKHGPLLIQEANAAAKPEVREQHGPQYGLHLIT